MRVYSSQTGSFPPPAASIKPPDADKSGNSSAYPAFIPFSSYAFSQAHARKVPVFLLIGEITPAFSDPSVRMYLNEQTVPVHLPAGVRPDVELLCQRAGALFSGEGALPLAALLLSDARPFLAAPLPPPGYPTDPARLYAWLSHAGRRFAQNPAGLSSQAAEVIRSFQTMPLKKPYAPKDAAHDLTRMLFAAEDKENGGFGDAKSPLVCALRFLQHEAGRGSRQAHTALDRTLHSMLSSSVYDPLDGLLFRAALTDDWRAFIPEKPLAINAMTALILLDNGRRSEAIRLLDSIISVFSLEGGALSPALSAPREAFSFTPEQVCAALGSEEGLRACRLLALLRRHARAEPDVSPSRFSPVPAQYEKQHPEDERPVLYPVTDASISPEDSAFLRRVTPKLQRMRAVRSGFRTALPVITEHMALAAAVLARCGQKLGETRYTQAAQRAVNFIISQPPAIASPCPLPACAVPASPLLSQATCGAAAGLALALLTLGSKDGMEEYAQSGLRILGGALHAFVRPDGLVMHTPQDSAAFFPRVPAIFDSDLPSPAALLVHCLRIADKLRPEAHYTDAIETIWETAAPSVRSQPFSCASLIDASGIYTA